MMKESQGCGPIVIHLGSDELMKFLFHSRLTLFQCYRNPNGSKNDCATDTS